MKRAIQSLIALTFAVVVACGFQAQPAHAASECGIVTSTNPCILKITDENNHDVSISTGQVLLAVYTNDSFSKPVNITLSAAGTAQDAIVLLANESKWKNYSFNNVNGISIAASKPVGKIDATVVLVQAQSEQK